MKTGRGVLLAISIIFLGGAGIASAADVVAPAQEQAPAPTGWTFNAAPYAWLAGIDGSIGQFGFPPVDVDASVGDILENFDIGLMGAGEARNGQWGIAMDFMYVRLSADADTPFGVLADHIDVTSTTFTAFGAAEYRLAETPDMSLDILGGARVWSVDTEVDPVGGLLDPLSFSDGDTWVDPMLGAKARVSLTDTVYVTGWGMVGGFGAGSKVSWDVMGALGYSVTDSFSLVGGWRALGVDYENGDFVFDVVQSGPILGAVIRF
jgi:hypothetical protein